MKLRATQAFVVGAFMAGAISSAQQFTIYAAETTPGSLGGNTGLYGGVQRFDFSGTSAAAVSGTGIAASQLADPAGLRFRNNTLYIGNRHGNTQGLGSVSAAAWDGFNLGAVSTIANQASPSHQGFHGLDVAGNGDLFVATVNAGTRRFRDSGSGYVDIGGIAPNPTQVRDALLSADGTLLYESMLGNSFRVTQVTPTGFGSSSVFSIAGADALHQLAWRGGAIYAAGFNSGTVHRIDLDANGMVAGSAVVANVAGGLGVAFSADGNEMFVSGHQSGLISRFVNSGSSWNANGTINAGHTLGYLATVPEPASLSVLGLGALAMLRRRKR